jgi:hypothetical protein
MGNYQARFGEGNTDSIYVETQMIFDRKSYYNKDERKIIWKRKDGLYSPLQCQ